MAYLIPAGAVITVLGMLGLIYCIVKVARARKANLDDDAMRAALQSVVALNMGALLLSGIGLMMVVLGIILT